MEFWTWTGTEPTGSAEFARRAEAGGEGAHPRHSTKVICGRLGYGAEVHGSPALAGGSPETPSGGRRPGNYDPC